MLLTSVCGNVQQAESKALQQYLSDSNFEISVTYLRQMAGLTRLVSSSPSVHLKDDVDLLTTEFWNQCHKPQTDGRTDTTCLVLPVGSLEGRRWFVNYWTTNKEAFRQILGHSPKVGRLKAPYRRYIATDLNILLVSVCRNWRKQWSRRPTALFRYHRCMFSYMTQQPLKGQLLINTLMTGSFKLFKRPLPGFLTILTL
jgi:hypothetical protein